jgi:hypothetical protein
MCHTQEIAFEPKQDEWRAVDEWSEDVTTTTPCEATVTCGACFRPNDSHVEEVLVVHHEALQKVDFLLHHDELELRSCDSPAVPECVTAVRRSKILKCILARQGPRIKGRQGIRQEQSILASRRELSTIPEYASQQPCMEDSDDPSDEASSGSDSKAPGDFIYDSNLNSVEMRLIDGMDMWKLSFGRDNQMLQEAVLMQTLEWDSSVLRITGSENTVDFPMTCVTCVELITMLEKPSARATGVRPTLQGLHESMREIREERGMYVYLIATKQHSKADEPAFHFAFQDAKDAKAFRNWMRTFFPSQVVSANDSDPVPWYAGGKRE